MEDAANQTPDHDDNDGFASLQDLLGKPRRKVIFSVQLPTENGGLRQAKLEFQALPPDKYDELLAEHPPKGPNKEQELWNAETFEPALVAAVSHRPRLSLDDVKSLWANSNWSAGERRDVFLNALGVNNRGLDVPFSAGA